MTEWLVTWLPTSAALCHFLQLPSMRWVQERLSWKEELQRLQPFSRNLVLLFALGIVACVAGLGLVVLVSHGQLCNSAAGSALCLFLGIFWLARGVVQSVVFSAIWPRSVLWVHRGLAVLYPALGLAYLTAWALSQA